MLTRSDIYDLVPHAVCPNPEGAARLRGAIFVDLDLRVSDINWPASVIGLTRMMEIAGQMNESPEDYLIARDRILSEALSQDVSGALIDTVLCSVDPYYDRNTGILLEGVQGDRKTGLEIIREERVWERTRRAKGIVVDASMNRIAVLRDDNQVYFRLGSEWRPAKCGAGGFVEGDWVYLQDDALVALDPVIRARRAVLPSPQLTARILESVLRLPGEYSEFWSDRGMRPLKLSAVLSTVTGPLFCMSSCIPEETVVVLDARGNVLFSAFGERCCGHLDWAVPVAEGWLVPHSHDEGVELVRPEGTRAGVERVSGRQWPIRSRNAESPVVGLCSRERIKLFDPDLSCTLDFTLPWSGRDRGCATAISDDGTRVAVGSRGGRVLAFDRLGHSLGETTLEWEIDAIAFVGSHEVLVGHGPGFLTTLRVPETART